MPDFDVVFVDVLADIRHEIGGDFKGLAVKDDEGDVHAGIFIVRFFIPQEGGEFRQGDLEGLVFWETVDAGRDQRKGDAAAAEMVGDEEGFAVAGSEEFEFTVVPAHPGRADRMDDKLRGQSESFCDRRFTGLNIANLFAFREEPAGAGRVIDGAVCPTREDRLRIGRVDDGVGADFCNVVSDNTE